MTPLHIKDVCSVLLSFPSDKCYAAMIIVQRCVAQFPHQTKFQQIFAYISDSHFIDTPLQLLQKPCGVSAIHLCVVKLERDW